ncbi:CRISPR-associated helicase Cas3' [Chengkuizengella sediminis]|uniref:CRISPR-associated helicase Cas3' n=1 Tax=Chengkuizengella sediminis TaxID=1885917 RepID=UPI001389C212|nr:CRISPR-associated helicase Cas3' [Chengkuizengella sediminis]NDI36004.1 CRISPR-associated helicase Cas3' [Chengkuizengella sediminis]
MHYIAHIRESDKHIQTVKEHLLEVKELAESFGAKIGVKHLAGLAGLLHDLGKYTDEFRNYILEAIKNLDAPPKKGSVDHSTAGGKLLYNLFHTDQKNDQEIDLLLFKMIVAEIVGNAIISHHSYLQDFLSPNLESDYLKRVRDKKIIDFDKTKQYFFNYVMSEADFHEYVNKAVEELKQFNEKNSDEIFEKKLMFLTKFIFSALIDADRTNTRLFEENKIDETKQNHQELFELYYTRLMDKLNSFKNDPDATKPINVLRTNMSDQCEQFAEHESGIYTLSIPTGGGKTLASLRYALKHAIIHNKKRIIYVVPYTTIIEQNAKEIRDILDDSRNILEHHSNVVEHEIDDDENEDGTMSLQEKLSLAKDNWDSPIIFTTMVQFLDVFYAKGTRNIRRLHNLSEAVIIFDEVQKVPISCISLFNESLNFLKNYCHSSIILCTATQPALDFVKHHLDINKKPEIIKQLDHVVEAFKRVEIIDRATNETFNNDKLYEFIEEQMEQVQSVLVILNTKAVVKDLYNLLNEKISGIPIYHLSTSMCGAHRKEILNEVRDRLEATQPIICISTPLIEAGVDISFDCVVRSLAGLDSIAQAAGRCNRHGKEDFQYAYVIDHEEENLAHLKEIQKGKKISSEILKDLKQDRTSYGGHILSRLAMKKYFKEFYIELETNLYYFVKKLKRNMTELLMETRNNNSYHKAFRENTKQAFPLISVNSYKTAAKHFHVIEEVATSIIVPYGDDKDEGKDIIAELNSNHSIQDFTILLRNAQQYTINLYPNEYEQLVQNKGLESCLDGKILVLKEAAYDGEFGLNVKNDSRFGLLDY